MAKRRWLMLAAGALALVVAAPGFADDKADRKEARKEAADKARDARKELKDDRKDLKDAIKSGDAAAAKSALDELREDRKKLRDAREDRRKARRQELKAKWGDLLDKPAVRAELRLHGQRVARLNWIEKLAVAEKKDELAKKAKELRERENARHQKRMDDLKAKNGDDK